MYSSKAVQNKRQAAILDKLSEQLEVSRRQRNTPLKASIRDFKAMDSRPLQRPRPWAVAPHNQTILLQHHFNLSRTDPGQGNKQFQLVTLLIGIDQRLPTGQ